MKKDLALSGQRGYYLPHEQRPNDNGQGGEAVSGRGSYGSGVLVTRGGEGSPINRYAKHAVDYDVRASLPEAVKTFAARGDLHTIKVCEIA